MMTSTVQVATGLQEYMCGSWNTVGPPPVGAVAIITHEKEQSQGVLLSIALECLHRRLCLGGGIKGVGSKYCGLMVL